MKQVTPIETLKNACKLFLLMHCQNLCRYRCYRCKAAA